MQELPSSGQGAPEGPGDHWLALTDTSHLQQGMVVAGEPLG